LRENNFTGYEEGAFTTQPDLHTLQLHDNDLSESDIDAVLSDLVTSLDLEGRVTCEVRLQDNAPPSSDGMDDIDTLEAEGWTITYDDPEE